MEAEKEVGFLEKIRPPRLEDAGLEDCALPPDSIMEAFFKAASSVSSRSASDADESGGDCVNESSPEGRSKLPPSEKDGELIGNGDVGGGSDAGKEEVTKAPSEAAEEEEKGGGGAICVDEMRGLKIGDK